jgi:outer membrane lipoprotein-sorting protein
MAKLSEYYHKKKSMNGEMTKFIAISKQWQEQKFKTLLKNG